jgi:hypothetical protein
MFVAGVPGFNDVKVLLSTTIAVVRVAAFAGSATATVTAKAAAEARATTERAFRRAFIDLL